MALVTGSTSCDTASLSVLGGIDSVEYRRILTVRLGRKSDSNNAVYTSKAVQPVPSPSSSVPWVVTSQRRVNTAPPRRETLAGGGNNGNHIGAW